ncbi:DMT family transporter [Desulfococcaceae bacterium HSG7]|nr:DMT family transporter [Desulfococcaceae bacterium HSG7]
MTERKIIVSHATAKGPMFMFGSAFLFAILGLLIKMMGPDYRVWDIAMYRLGGGGIVLLALFGWKQNLFKPQNPKLIIIRGMTGTIAFLALVTAIRNLPFSTAMVFFYSFPAFAAIFSPLLFGEKITLYEVVCLIAALIGIGVLFDFHIQGTLFGQFMGVVGAIFAGLTVSMIKKLRPTHSSVIIYFYFCLIGTIVCFWPYMSAPRIPTAASDWLIVAGILITSVGAQLLMNMGFRYCKSWEGGLFMTSELIFSTIIGILFLGEIASWRFWIGGLLIFGSVAAFKLQHR